MAHHVRKARFRGSETNVEAWRRGTIPPHALCTGCGRSGCAVWIRTYLPVVDFERVYGAGQVIAHALRHGGTLPIYPTAFGPMVFVAEAFACVTCAPAAERAAAQHPSYALVEVRKGPQLQRPFVQVPREGGA